MTIYPLKTYILSVWEDYRVLQILWRLERKRSWNVSSHYRHSPGSNEKDHLKPGYFFLRSPFFWGTSTLSRNVRLSRSANFVTIGAEAVVEYFKSLYRHSPGSNEKDHLKRGYFFLRSPFFWGTSTLPRNVRHPTRRCIPVERIGQCGSG